MAQTESLRSFLDYFPDAFAYHQIILDDKDIPVDYIFIEINTAFEEMTGLSREKVIGNKVTEILPGILTSRFNWIATYGRVALTGESDKFEQYSEPLNRWYEVEVTSDKPGFFVTVFRDISDKKKVEYKLHEQECFMQNITKEAEEWVKQSKDCFRLIAELAPVGIVIYDNEQNTIYINQKFTDLFGYTLEDLPTVDKWWPLAYPYEMQRKRIRQEWNTAVEMAVKTQSEIRPMEYQVTCKNGTLCDIEFRMANRGNFNVVTFTDVKERKEAEKALKENEKNLNFLFSQTLHGAFFMTLDEPMLWNDSVDKEKALDYFFRHQRVTKVNQAMLDQYGAEEKEFLGLTPYDLFKHDLEYGRHVMRGLLNLGSWHVETDERRMDGSQIWVEGDYKCMYDDQGRVIGHFGVQSDVTERKQNEKALRENEEKYRTLVSNIPGVVFRCNNDAHWTMEFISDDIVEITGYPSEDFIHNKVKTYNSVIYPDDQEMVAKVIMDNIQKRKPYSVRYRILNSENEVRWVHENGQGVHDKNGLFQYLDGVIIDITEMKKAEEALEKSEYKFKSFVENSSDIIFIVTEDGLFNYVSPNWKDILGHDVSEVVGKTPADFTPQEDAKKCFEYLKRTLRGEDVSCGVEYQVFHKDGSIRWHATRGSVIDDNGVKKFLGIARDTTVRKQAEDKIRYLSYHDSLTGLYNRAYLEQEMQRLDTKRQLPVSIVMADLNGLKLINDTYGHGVGDEMLINAAEILKNSCRKEDIVARWSGDEFVIFLPQTTVDEAQEVCRRIVDACTAADVKKIPLSMALGVGSKKSMETELTDVLKEAEDSMYKHKLAERRSTKSAVLNALLKTLEEKSYETEEHARRMQEIAMKIGKKINLPETELDRLTLLVYLHDIGKITVPEETLTKKEKLTEKDWEHIKKHPESGYRIARSMEEFAHIAEDILCHHEHWDGSGYPKGLKGKEIPLLARIAAIVDAYEVMTNGRPYKEPLSHGDVIAELKRCAGTQFDPELVDVFLSIFEEQNSLACLGDYFYYSKTSYRLDINVTIRLPEGSFCFESAESSFALVEVKTSSETEVLREIT